jgi:hypothetical protein
VRKSQKHLREMSSKDENSRTLGGRLDSLTKFLDGSWESTDESMVVSWDVVPLGWTIWGARSWAWDTFGFASVKFKMESSSCFESLRGKC